MSKFKIVLKTRQIKFDIVGDSTLSIERRTLHEFDTEATDVKNPKTTKDIEDIFYDTCKSLFATNDEAIISVTLQVGMERDKNVTDLYWTNLLEEYRPRTVDEVENMLHLLEGIDIEGQYYFVYSTTTRAEAEADEEAGAYCFFMDDESPCFEFYTLDQLANNTKVAFYTSENI